MHNTKSRLLVDAETDQHGASWQVTFNEIAGTIQGVNPNNGIFGVKRREVLSRNLIRVSLQKLLNVVAALRLVFDEPVFLDESLNSVSNLLGLHC